MLRNPYACLPDFTDIDGCIKKAPKVRPSDIDMVLERNGKFLVGEWKKPLELVSEGQQIMLLNLARMPGFTILLITGIAEQGEPMQIESIHMLTQSEPIQCGSSVDDLKQLINRWYDWADEHGKENLS